MKKIISAILILFILSTSAVIIYRKLAASNGKLELEDKDRIVYYFHGTKRCYTCNLIENQTVKALNDGFKKEMTDGTIKFRSINLDKPENEHFVKDFQLKGRVIVMAYLKNSKPVYKRIDDVFTRVRQGDKFLEYIKAQVAVFLLKRKK
ncbi:MAG: hypothetical protein JXR95_09465 [Deltaproteobacteria bacterium]|nr:hypothetical protein [Deltaproteobacteria bacterium]